MSFGNLSIPVDGILSLWSRQIDLREVAVINRASLLQNHLENVASTEHPQRVQTVCLDFTTLAHCQLLAYLQDVVKCRWRCTAQWGYVGLFKHGIIRPEHTVQAPILRQT